MQLFCAAACFLFTAVASLKTSKLAFGSNSDVFDVALLCSHTETFRGLNSCICALTSFSEGSCSALLSVSCSLHSLRYQHRNSGGRSVSLLLTENFYSLRLLPYKHRTRLWLKQRCF